MTDIKQHIADFTGLLARTALLPVPTGLVVPISHRLHAAEFLNSSVQQSIRFDHFMNTSGMQLRSIGFMRPDGMLDRLDVKCLGPMVSTRFESRDEAANRTVHRLLKQCRGAEHFRAFVESTSCKLSLVSRIVLSLPTRLSNSRRCRSAICVQSPSSHTLSLRRSNFKFLGITDQ